jgi:hypothetical protein
MEYDNKNSMEIRTERSDKIELSEKKDKPHNKRVITIMKGNEKNVRYYNLDLGPYRVAVTANDRRAVNPLAMDKFLKVNKIREVLEINKPHNYRSDLTFKTSASANELLSHPYLIN